MVLWRFFHWLIGSCTVEIAGPYGERFLSLCMRENVEIWDLQRTAPGILRLRMFASDRKRLPDLCDSCGCTHSVLSVFGFPFLLRRYRFRPGLFLGLLLYPLLLFLLSSAVWSVEIPGADPIRASQIRTVLLESGFGVGVFRRSVDFKELKYRLMLRFDDIAFVSVNMRGCRAMVDVRFADTPPVHVDESTPCNLVASRDGQIVSILVKDGVRYAKKGQTVQKGDLLVGGIVDTRLGYYVVHAKAEILARVTDVVSHTVPLVSEQSVRTGRCKRVFVWTVFGKEISFPSSSCSYDSYETVRETKYLSFGENAAVPVVLTEIRYYETVPVSVELTEEQAAEQARVFLNESDRIRLNGVSVESFSERTERVGDCVTVIRTRGLIVDICEEKEFYFEGEGH